MEHLVQFTFNFDDNAIQRKIEDCAYNDVVNKMYADLKTALGRKYCKHGFDWETIAWRSIEGFLEEHRQEIIDTTASYLVEKLRRTKAVREAAEDAVKEAGL